MVYAPNIILTRQNNKYSWDTSVISLISFFIALHLGFVYQFATSASTSKDIYDTRLFEISSYGMRVYILTHTYIFIIVRACTCIISQSSARDVINKG